MQLYYWQTALGNFGDDMNAWFWDDLMPGWRDGPGDATLIGIGSLLSTNLALPEGRKIVAGAGAGYGNPPALGPDWDLRFVRGPRSAAALGLPASAGLTDPAALAVRLRRFADIRTRGRRPLFIPHCYSDVDRSYDWPAIATAGGVDYLSPRGNAVGVIQAIAGAPLVLTESLHGAIIADAFRVPWRPVRVGVSQLKLFKWQDWCASLELAMPEVVDVFAPIERLRRLATPGRRSPPKMTGGAYSRPVPAPPRISGEQDGPGFRTLVRDRIRLGVAARSLSRAARMPPVLSRDDVLQDRLDRITLAIRDLARDCGARASL